MVILGRIQHLFVDCQMFSNENGKNDKKVTASSQVRRTKQASISILFWKLAVPIGWIFE